MGIALRGRQALVPQQLLDGAQVHIGIQQMGRVTVAQGVGGCMARDSDPTQPLPQHLADPTVREARAPDVQEQRLPEQPAAWPQLEVAGTSATVGLLCHAPERPIRGAAS